MKNEPEDLHVSFLEVARLSTPSARREAIKNEEPFVSEGSLKVKLPPDEHLMVIDFSYYMGMVRSWEWNYEYFEPWRIASHAHWAPKMRSLAEKYLMRHFGVDTVKAIPKVGFLHFGTKKRMINPFRTVYSDPCSARRLQEPVWRHTPRRVLRVVRCHCRARERSARRVSGAARIPKARWDSH
jgi:hypothetical protein